MSVFGGCLTVMRETLFLGSVIWFFDLMVIKCVFCIGIGGSDGGISGGGRLMVFNGKGPGCESGKGEEEDGCGLDTRVGLGPGNGFVIFDGPETI